ncbi:cysteine desulfurase [Echinicola sp. CAU 1574]|uniref:Cysteine desulfurase n=1 Tax=Echinicola arenosa TaxID=2774144 RepID=A0ABR9AP05_9BACT|nr:cysteine desulfurase family protein [Echinicola arenosa]MBD8489349.1 cysteine desulfurase [Echinicola arenosa]
MKRPIYLDYCATTPCDPEVVKVMMPYFSHHFGNPSSNDHLLGWESKEAVEVARQQLATLINCKPKDLIFTSGATESINWVLKGLFHNNGRKGHFITTKIEHSAVLDTMAYLQEQGAELTFLEVDQNGQILLDDLESSIQDNTLGFVCMYANNEIGTILPIDKIGEITVKYNIDLICDGTQAVGKIPMDLSSSPIAYMAFSAHKMYGPKGIGGLYIANSDLKSKLGPFLHGGKQEGSFRSGTMNVPGIVGFGKAAALCYHYMEVEFEQLSSLRDYFELKLGELSGVIIQAFNGNRLPNVSNVSFSGVEGERLILNLSKYMAVSRGSACSSIIHRPSHVLKAIGMSDEDALNAIRFSLGRFTTKEEVETALKVIRDTVLDLKMNIV